MSHQVITPAFVTIAQAAAEIGCTRRFLQRRIADRELAVFQPSKRLVRIRRSELERWVATFTHGGAR